MEQEQVTMRLAYYGGRFVFPDGREGGLQLTWGLWSADHINRSGERGALQFVFKWRFESRDPDRDAVFYTETVKLPVTAYKSEDSFKLPLTDALKKLLTRFGYDSAEFVTFVIRHLEPFFTKLKAKLDDIVINLSIITDVFEQPLLLSPSEIDKLKTTEFRYPENVKGKKE